MLILRSLLRRVKDDTADRDAVVTPARQQQQDLHAEAIGGILAMARHPPQRLALTALVFERQVADQVYAAIGGRRQCHQHIGAQGAQQLLL